MAQKEIVLQQVRTGKQRDLPNALEKGQLGFTTDEGRMFVGLPSSSEPASLVAQRDDPNSGKENVEIITEFSPWKVVNGLVNKPFMITVPANSTVTTRLQGTSRLFLEYVAYSDNGSNKLESGAVQMVSINGTVLLSQQNNTNSEDGIVVMDFQDPSYDIPSSRMSITIKNNSSTDEFKVEFIVRGWNEV